MDNVLGMIGLARRARAAQAGGEIVLKAIKSHKARLVIIASDASDNTKKSITDSCRFYKVEYMEYSDKAALGSSIGTDICVAVAITDTNFSGAIKSKIMAAQGKDR